MKTEIIIIIAVTVGFVAAWLSKLRHTFIVPEGYAGLLYSFGKYVETLGSGRHVRWGRNLTVEAADLRKTALTVAGQEVLTRTT